MPRLLVQAAIIRFPLRRPAKPSLAAELLDMMRSFARDLFASYRPERHYMRGPGPKWHAKHGRMAASETASAAVKVAA